MLCALLGIPRALRFLPFEEEEQMERSPQDNFNAPGQSGSEGASNTDAGSSAGANTGSTSSFASSGTTGAASSSGGSPMSNDVGSATNEQQTAAADENNALKRGKDVVQETLGNIREKASGLQATLA